MCFPLGFNMSDDENDEVAALVVDNGSGRIKAGFAGDDAPRNENYYLKKIVKYIQIDQGSSRF